MLTEEKPTKKEKRPKTLKREVATATLLFWAGLIIWGHLDPSTGAAETGLAITMPVFLLVAGAYGIDAVFRQGQPAQRRPERLQEPGGVE